MFPRPDQGQLTALMIPPAGMSARLAQQFAGAVESRSEVLSVRPESPSDLEFQHALFASTRTHEMALVEWPAEDKQAFLQQQSAAQILHYRRHYPNAVFLVCEQAGRPIGRVYLSPSADELRLMDIALLPRCRSGGVGRVLMAAVVAVAQLDDLPVGLHVEPSNPAAEWYRRLGFEVVREVGVYRFMRLPTKGLPAAQLKLIS